MILVDIFRYNNPDFRKQEECLTLQTLTIVHQKDIPGKYNFQVEITGPNPFLSDLDNEFDPLNSPIWRLELTAGKGSEISFGPWLNRHRYFNLKIKLEEG